MVKVCLFQITSNLKDFLHLHFIHRKISIFHHLKLQNNICLTLEIIFSTDPPNKTGVLARLCVGRHTKFCGGLCLITARDKHLHRTRSVATLISCSRIIVSLDNLIINSFIEELIFYFLDIGQPDSVL